MATRGRWISRNGPPRNPKDGDVWVDLSDPRGNITKVHAGGSWHDVTSVGVDGDPMNEMEARARLTVLRDRIDAIQRDGLNIQSSWRPKYVLNNLLGATRVSGMPGVVSQARAGDKVFFVVQLNDNGQARHVLSTYRLAHALFYLIKLRTGLGFKFEEATSEIGNELDLWGLRKCLAYLADDGSIPEEP